MIRRHGLLVLLFLFPVLTFGGLWWYVHRDQDEPSPVSNGKSPAAQDDGKLPPFIVSSVDPRKLLEQGEIEKVRKQVAEDPRVAIYLE